MSENLWNDERVDRLRILLSEGYSAREIACRIGQVSRNAVIGKIYRLGLSQKQSRPVILPMINLVSHESEKDVCQWPFGHPTEDDFHFCGGEVVAGKPYCVSHCAVAYRQNITQVPEAA